jgi:hypothetical protein
MILSTVLPALLHTLIDRTNSVNVILFKSIAFNYLFPSSVFSPIRTKVLEMWNFPDKTSLVPELLALMQGDTPWNPSLLTDQVADVFYNKSLTRSLTMQII